MVATGALGGCGPVFCLHDDAWAEEPEGKDKIRLTGSIQSDVLLPQSDEKTGAQRPSSDFPTNTYAADLTASSRYVDAGVRMEYMRGTQAAGLRERLERLGHSHYYVKGRYQTLELTLGSFTSNSVRALCCARTKSVVWA